MTEQLLAQPLEPPSGTGRDDPECHQPTVPQSPPRTRRTGQQHSHWAIGATWIRSPDFVRSVALGATWRTRSPGAAPELPIGTA